MLCTKTTTHALKPEFYSVLTTQCTIGCIETETQKKMRCAMCTELVSLKNLDVLYTWSPDINAFNVTNIE
jgi:hypothetical protein